MVTFLFCTCRRHTSMLMVYKSFGKIAVPVPPQLPYEYGLTLVEFTLRWEINICFGDMWFDRCFESLHYHFNHVV